MADFLFAIGSTLETLTNLRELPVPIQAVRSQHFDYARTVNKGNQGKRGIGFPTHIWDVGVPTIEERNQLKAYCPGASEAVFIYTKLNDINWSTFQCEMIWPEDEEWWAGETKKRLLITFRGLIPVEEGS